MEVAATIAFPANYVYTVFTHNSLSMPNITLSVPPKLKKAMAEHKELNWSEVARQAIEDKLDQLDTMNKLLSKSRITQADIDKEAREIKRRVWKKYQKKSK